MKIKRIEIRDFKGIKEKAIDFSDKTVISGKNASGKSTIATAWFWLLFDKDINLVSNPKIQPNGVEESIPSVTAIIDVDGKPVTLTKTQKTKKSKPDSDGVQKISLSNVYEVNSVPKAEKDFRAYLDELGLPNANDMLMASHTDVFTNMKQADMRTVLFGMATEKSDIEIAESLGTPVKDVAELLKNYKVEEISAMNKASIKKANEQVESIPDIIAGLEKGKTDVDVAELELYKNSLNEKILSIESEIKSLNEQKNEYNNLMSKNLDLEFNKNALKARLIEESNSGKKELEKEYNTARNYVVDVENKLRALENDVEYRSSRVEEEQKRLDSLSAIYHKAKDSKFDESSTKCPCCGQEYPAEKKEEMRESFRKNRDSQMKKAVDDGNRVKAVKETLELELSRAEESASFARNQLLEAKEKLNDVKERLDSFTPENTESSAELDEIEAEIEENKSKVSAIPNDIDIRINNLSDEILSCKSEISETDKKIGQNEQNEMIDAQIAELEDKRLEYEQSKADAEKILHELDLLSRAKNEQLADDINSHFKIVKFKFFDYLKNSNYKECCVPMTNDNKELGISTNTALEVMMKIDICVGLQEYFGVRLPMWIDNAECLDSNSLSKIESSAQEIFLSVTDDSLSVSSL